MMAVTLKATIGSCEPGLHTNNVYDYGVNKDVENLPQRRDRMSAMIDNYHNVQQGRDCLALSNPV